MRLGDTTAVPPPNTNVSAARPDQPQTPRSRVRVVVIDPGHGGTDIGTKNTTMSEKDLTLTIARKLRTALEGRLGATVLLTRDSDIALDNEARSAVANNNQANLFISLHIGYSPNNLDASSSIFVMKDDFGTLAGGAAPTRGQLFLPWYLGYRPNLTGSLRAATLLQEELGKAITGWKFPVRTAPLGVLTSTTMPSLLLELGNLNNTINSQTLTDAEFQSRLVTIITNAVQRFSETEPTPSNSNAQAH